MKKNLVLVCSLFLSVFLSSAQNIDGTYKNGTDSLVLSNGKAVFCLSGFGALFTQVMGEGTYEYFNDYLLIHTGDYSKEKTTVDTNSPAKKDTTLICIYSSDGYAMDGVLAEMLNPSGKAVGRSVSDNSGTIIVPKNDKIRRIRISNMGYDGIEFDCQPQKNYTITMVKNDIIENQTVVIRVKPVDEDILSVLFLSDDFNSGKDRDKALEKLVRQAEKKNLLDKRLRREYIPIYGRQRVVD
ncbi:MAG: hypothetical protein LBR48_07805 [Dysgonamonadaceae bacterium]|jgi:hypothetical protein|nr:hypothetical protein [Dysgonamonadaceae bacterium]